jgi:hypothetical protein
MSILTDIPQRKRFDDFSERGAFHAWMKHAIIFAVIACIASFLILFLVDSRQPKKEKEPVNEKTTEKLPVVADLPMKAKPTKAPPPSGSSTKSTKSGASTGKKTAHPPSNSKTSPHKTTPSN